MVDIAGTDTGVNNGPTTEVKNVTVSLVGVTVFPKLFHTPF